MELRKKKNNRNSKNNKEKKSKASTVTPEAQVPTPRTIPTSLTQNTKDATALTSATEPQTPTSSEPTDIPASTITSISPTPPSKSRTKSAPKPPKSPLLTKRQEEYLVLVSLGLNNNEISKILSVSENTVKMTLKLIFEKLKTNSRLTTVITCYKKGIIDDKKTDEIIKRYNVKIKREIEER